MSIENITENVVIRRAIDADIARIVEIENSCFGDPWSERAFLDALHDRNQIYFCITIDGEIAGYCGLMTVLDEGQILNIAVDENYRRRGLAGLLLDEMFCYGREHGITLFTLEVRESNIAARMLYKKIGFIETGMRPRYYTDPVETAVLMDKTI